jgi:vitamin B12 transporter
MMKKILSVAIALIRFFLPEQARLAQISIVIALISLNANAVLGPIPIYLNAEYRTDTPVIDSIAATIILDSEMIEKTGASSLVELLATIPSVNLVNPVGNIPAIFIRGNEARHTLVLLDGIKIHDISSTDGAVGQELYNIALNDIEKIEIIKNAGSVLYGSSAIAGVIAITTKKGANGVNATVKLGYGSHNTKTYALNTNAGDGDNFIRFNVNKNTSDGISALTKDDEKDGYDNQSVNLKLGAKIKNTKIMLDILSNDSYTEYDDSFADEHDKYLDKKSTKISLNIENKVNDIWDSKFMLARNKQQKDTFTNGVSDGFNEKEYQTTDLTLINNIKFDQTLLNIGLSKIEDTDITDNQTLTSEDLFAQWQQKFKGFDVNTGTRFINHSKFGSEAIYTIGTATNMGGARFSVSYNTAFNAPTIYQLLNNDSFAQGNSELKPETSQNIEIGFERQHSWGLVSARLFQNKVVDLIVYEDTDTVDYHNEDNLSAKGIELSFAKEFSGYQINFNHTFVDSKLNDSGVQQARRPKNSIDLTVGKKIHQFDTQIQLIGKSSSLDGGVKLDGYTLMNVSSSYPLSKKTKISLNFNNVFDKNYTVADGYNQAGRSVNLTLNQRF